jgi:tetratricopeptide (TPR) repeat protein
MDDLLSIKTLLQNGQYLEVKSRLSAFTSYENPPTFYYFGMGLIFFKEEAYDRALEYLTIAINQDPFEPDFYNYFTQFINFCGVLQRGIAFYLEKERIIDDSDIPIEKKALLYGKLGVGLGIFNALLPALACINKGLTLSPLNLELTVAKSFILLSLKQLEAGFDLFDAVYTYLQPNPPYPQEKLWQGQPLAGKTILLHAEQGYGDAIMYLRYVPFIGEVNTRILLEAPSLLTRLFASFPRYNRLVTIVDHCSNEVYDYHCPLMLLAKYSKMSVSSVSQSLPYLFVEDVPRFPFDKTRKNIGLVWAGNPEHTSDFNRSCPVTMFEPLLGIVGTSFYALQCGERMWDLRYLKNPSKLRNLVDKVHDFQDMAGIVSQLDLVITVDTAMAHLCGALGINAWVILPYVAEWRWCLDETSTPWYPSLRLWRQAKPRDWASVIASMHQALLNEIPQ